MGYEDVDIGFAIPEIVNLVVARTNWLIDSLGKRKSVWYFPTEFAQYALSGHHNAEYVRTIYQDKFMPTNSIVSKIFIPMNDEGVHWYLLVVDFIERKLIWLDSLPSEARYHSRRHAILRLVIFLEQILLHSSFHELNLIGSDNLITNFSIVQPRCLPQQRPGS
ncbi:Ulp1 protease family carboxy-terminal domain protein, partial [Trifolium medium]|nr:Ulp1 protease family carboxy-terminal domain protein [Trifolium medium]